MSESVAKVGKAYPIDPRTSIGELNISSLRVTKTDIELFRNAVDTARSALSPRRGLLYDMYYSIILDAHLQSVLMKRITAITNHKVKFIDAAKDGEPNEFIEDKILHAPWFYKMLEIIMETRAFGHSLIELIPVNGLIAEASLLPRHNVHPEYLWFSYQYNQPQPGVGSGFYYRDDPKYSKWLLEIGGMKDYGFLMYAAPWIIYKRSGMADWAQFAEIFGMPFREGRYDPYDDNNRKLLIEGLENMGGAAYAAIPKGAEINFHETSKTGTSELYKDLVNLCDEQVSKLVLGGTMTVDNGSSRSQSEVHAKGEDDINLADMIWIEHILNGPFKEKLIGLGYPIPDGKFCFPETTTIPLTDRIKIDVEVSKLVAMPIDYFYKTYGIEKPDGAIETTGGPAPAPDIKSNDPTNDPASKKVDQKKKPKLTAEHMCLDFEYTHNRMDFTMQSITDDQFLKAIYQDNGIKFDYESFKSNLDKLQQGLNEGIGIVTDYNHPDNLCKTMMEVNVNRFGFDKTIAEVTELNQAVRESKTFNDFKEKAANILGNYNKHFLETEYNLAISVGQNAARWNRQLAEQDQYPYLRYQTAEDDRVRPAHAALNRMVFKVSDTSWRRIYPPNGYGCRCEMIQLRADQVKPSEVATGPAANAALGEELDKMKAAGFYVNRGDAKEVFDLNKVYAEQLASAKKINMSELTHKDFGADAFDAISKTISTAINYLPISKQEILKKFDAIALDTKPATAVFNDYSKRLVGLPKTIVRSQIGDATSKSNEVYHLIDDVLAAPDEVYFNQVGDSWQYTYIKFYSDGAIVIPVKVVNETLSIQGWSVMDNPDSVRKGLCIKFNPNNGR